MTTNRYFPSEKFLFLILQTIFHLNAQKYPVVYVNLGVSKADAYSESLGALKFHQWNGKFKQDRSIAGEFTLLREMNLFLWMDLIKS